MKYLAVSYLLPHQQQGAEESIVLVPEDYLFRVDQHTFAVRDIVNARVAKVDDGMDDAGKEAAARRALQSKVGS